MLGVRLRVKGSVGSEADDIEAESIEAQSIQVESIQALLEEEAGAVGPSEYAWEVNCREPEKIVRPRNRKSTISKPAVSEAAAIVSRKEPNSTLA
jgi:hypothetical protein